MKKVRFIFLLFVIKFNSEAQPTFQKIISGANTTRGIFTQQTNDGGYIIVGSCTGFISGGDNINLIRTDSAGNVLWTKVYGGSDYDYPTSVKQTNDGGYIISGVTQSFGAGYMDVYLIRIDSNGDSLWTKAYGGTDLDWGYDVIQTKDGGFIVSGVSYSFGSGLYLIKTDDLGDTLWTKNYNGVAEGESILQMKDGGYIITGNFFNFSSASDGYLIRTDENGDTLWTRSFGGSDYEEGSFLKLSDDGGFILAGRTASFGAGTEDIYLSKIDSNGYFVWTKTFGGPGYDGFSPDVQQTKDGGFILCGNTESFGAGLSDAYLIKTNELGNLVWSKTFGGAEYDECFSVCQSADGGYFAVGGTRSFLTGNYDLYMIKTDSLGNSNCNEGNPLTVTTSPIFPIRNSLSLVISSTNTIVTSPTTLVAIGGMATPLCSSVGTNDLSLMSDEIQVFPNPSLGNFSVVFNNTISTGLIEIYNFCGQVIFSEKIVDEKSKMINIQNVSQGIYMMKVIDGKRSYCKKIVVE